MSDTSAFGFGKFVPGFDFLQNLSQTASKASPAAGAMPGMGSWVAPTLSIEEIDKRIQELKAVQFWLEQNGTALKATIQALEVQKMTLTTLQGMNVNMADLAKAFTAKPPVTPWAQAEPTPRAQPDPAPKAEPRAEPEPASAAVPDAAKAPSESESKEPHAKAGAKAAVDPMQWWGALTQQFQSIAAAAVKDVAAEAMKAGMSAKGASKGANKDANKGAAKKAAAPRKTAANKAASGAGQSAAKARPLGHKPAAKRRIP